MKNIKRILIECFIIAFVFGTVNFASGFAGKKKPFELTAWAKGFFPESEVTLSDKEARILPNIWSEIYENKYGVIGDVKIVVAYDKNTKKLYTAKVPIAKGMYHPESFNYLAQVYSASAVVESNNNLAERVRKLENRVQDFENKCCP